MKPVRPEITRSLALAELTGWYWLKAELVVMCRVWGLSTSGSKLQLEDRLQRNLSGRALKPLAKRTLKGKMPAVFSPDTVIGKGWRCNPALGRYFRGVLGSGFRFNMTMRNFIHGAEGRTLAEAAVCYLASTQRGASRLPIAAQLEYNQHFRDFFATQPGATRDEAIKAWWEKRSKPKSGLFVE